MKPETFEVQVHGKFGITPICMEEGSVGYDIALPEDFGDLVMPPQSRRAIDTGIVIKPPEKCFIMIVPRSSSRKKGIRLSNTVGIVDPSYCGPNDHLIVDITRDKVEKYFICTMPLPEKDFNSASSIMTSFYYKYPEHKKSVISYTTHKRSVHFYETINQDPVVYEAGERFCQVLFLPFYKPSLVEKTLKEFEGSDRGGFGSTGK